MKCAMTTFVIKAHDSDKTTIHLGRSPLDFVGIGFSQPIIHVGPALRCGICILVN